MMKKLLAFMLACMMLLSAMPVLAEDTAADESGWVNILMMGGDARSLTKYDRTDTMMLLSVNYEQREMKLTSILRDIYIRYPTRNYSAKINAANVYGGPELAVETISQAFEVDIANYVIINMADLVAIIDLVGGVTVNVTENERKYINHYVKDFVRDIHGYEGDKVLEETGDVFLNGMMATAYTRNRYSDNDFGRVMRQQEVLLGLARQLQEMELTDAMAMDMMQGLKEHIETDMTDEQLKDLAMMCLVVEVDNIQQGRVPTKGTFRYDEDNIVINMEKNIAYMHEFIYNNGDGNID